MADHRERLLISGFVQGVGYRDFTRRKALEYGLTGWCRNLPDGRVEALLCGSKDNVLRCLEDLKRGPQLARVSHIERQAVSEDKHYTEFEVTR